jgi:hypothetical protein
MAQYAQFDSKAPQPAPIVGWYDTEVFDYQNLPPMSDLIEVTASQWAMHFTDPNGWAVSDGKLVEDATPVGIA